LPTPSPSSATGDDEEAVRAFLGEDRSFDREGEGLADPPCYTALENPAAQADMNAAAQANVNPAAPVQNDPAAQPEMITPIPSRIQPLRSVMRMAWMQIPILGLSGTHPRSANAWDRARPKVDRVRWRASKSSIMRR
jgi:hypothetical protein